MNKKNGEFEYFKETCLIYTHKNEAICAFYQNR